MNREAGLVRPKISTSNSSDSSPFHRKRLTKSISREKTSIRHSIYHLNEGQSDFQAESSKSKICSNVIRAQSVEKLQKVESKNTRFLLKKGKLKLREGVFITKPIPARKGETLESKEVLNKNNISPNKLKSSQDPNKSRETHNKKSLLEIVSEVNEENAKEPQELRSSEKIDFVKEVSLTPKRKQIVSQDFSTKNTPYILEENFFVLAKADSPYKLKEETFAVGRGRRGVELQGSPRLRELEENYMSQKDMKRETVSESLESRERAPTQVRGLFMKEHISPVERQKEQDQKKLLKEQLDFQLSEKKRLKEEEKLRTKEQDKKLEQRVKRELVQMNEQYEKEIKTVKSRQDGRQISVNEKRRIVKNKAGYEIKINHNKEIENENEKKSLSMSSPNTLKKEDSKEEIETKNEQDPAGSKEEASSKENQGDENLNKMQLMGIKDIEKLTQENQQLRDQNVRKNELIDILISALKNQGQESYQNSHLQGYMQTTNTTQNKKRTISLLAPISSQENFDAKHPKPESLVDDRTGASPFLHPTNIPRFDTENLESKPEETINFLSGFSTIQSHSCRAPENLSKFVNPTVYYDFNLPRLPELNNNKRGYSSPLESNNLQSSAFISKSHAQQNHDNPLNVSHTHNKSIFGMATSNSATMLNGRPFSINSNTPINTLSIPKLKTELMTMNVTPKLSLPPSQFIQNGNESDIFQKHKSPSGIGSHRTSQSGSHLNLRKPFDNAALLGLQIPNSPFKNSMTNNNKALGDYKSPIRVLDMGSSQLILSNRSRENLKDMKMSKIIPDELKDSQFPPKLCKEPRFRSEPASVRTATLKTVANTDSNLEKNYREESEEAVIREFQQSANKARFPKEVFCLNLRKKAYA